MKRGLVLSAALIAMGGLVGCGESPTSPTANQSSFVVGQFAGTWTGATVLSGVSGGECVGEDLRNSVPVPDQGTVSLTQKSTDVTAVIRSSSTGLTCQYDGSASFTGFAASAVSCDKEILFQCSNGQSRILRPIGSTFTATQNGITATGTVTTSYNVFFVDPVTHDELPLAGLTVESQLSAIRR